VNDTSAATKCHGCLKLIAIAMHRYRDEHGHFPPAYKPDASGHPAHSWRVLLLDILDRELYAEYRFDEPWNGPNNRKLEGRMPSCYACPADQAGKARYRTNYFVVVGVRTMFPGTHGLSLTEVKRPTASTILVVESVGQDIHWMAPKDLSFDSMSFVINDTSKPSVSSRHRNGPNVVMVDATTTRLTNVAPGRLKEMFLVGPSNEND
jgi:hypothetical protein